MARNIAKVADQDWPGIRIHSIDIVHPPGMDIVPSMARQHCIVAQTAAPKATAAAATIPAGPADRRP